MKLQIAVALLLVAGCGKGDGKSSSSGGSKSAAKSGDKAGPAAAGPVFSGSAVTLPAELSKAVFGAAKADVLAALGQTTGYFSSKTLKEVSYDLDFDDEKLARITVKTDHDLLAELTALWGAPVSNRDGESFWFAPETGQRAWLPAKRKNSDLVISAYQPLSKHLGGKGFELAFAAGKPLFGATLDELQAAWGKTLCKIDEQGPKIKAAIAANQADSLAQLEGSMLGISVCWPIGRTTQIYHGNDDAFTLGPDGKVLMYRMSVEVDGSPGLAKLVIADLDAKFGTAIELKRGEDTVRTYLDPVAKLRAEVTVGPAWINLAMGPYMPLAELLGGDRPGLGIETASMPGGTFEKIQSEDPAHFRTQGVLASLVFPGTEFSLAPTEISLQRWAKETKTYGYRVVVHFTDREALGDEMFEMLKAKFGEPKADKRSTATDLFFNFAKGGRNVVARRVSQQWQIDVSK